MRAAFSRPGFKGRCSTPRGLVPVWAHCPPSLKRSFSRRVPGCRRLTPSLGRRKGAAFWTRAATDHVTQVARLLPPGLLQGPRPGPPSPRLPLASSRRPAGIGDRGRICRGFTCRRRPERGPRVLGPPGGGAAAAAPRGWQGSFDPRPGAAARFPLGLGALAPAPGPATSKGKIQRALGARGAPEQPRVASGSGCGASPLPRGLNRGSC